MSEIFETPLWVSADTENRCFEIYDNINDRVASDMEELVQAKLFAAAPEMYEALQKIASMTPGTSYDTDDECSYYESECGTCYEMIGIAQDALRKARGESEVSE